MKDKTQSLPLLPFFDFFPFDFNASSFWQVQGTAEAVRKTDLPFFCFFFSSTLADLQIVPQRHLLHPFLLFTVVPFSADLCNVF